MSKIDYNKDYYENGEELGISGYTNYRWLEEQTLSLARKISEEIKLDKNDKILDYGCAKGFLVKAFRLLGFSNSYGIDLSNYAIENCDQSVKNFVREFKHKDDFTFAFKIYDWIISKDVFEHVPYEEMKILSNDLSKVTRNLYAIIPLGTHNCDKKFIIEDYHNDKTHITILSISEWIKLLEQDWEIVNFTTRSNGIKDNWWNINNYGNGFFVLRSRQID